MRLVSIPRNTSPIRPKREAGCKSQSTLDWAINSSPRRSACTSVAAGPRAQIADPHPRRCAPRRFGLPRATRGPTRTLAQASATYHQADDGDTDRRRHRSACARLGRGGFGRVESDATTFGRQGCPVASGRSAAHPARSSAQHRRPFSAVRQPDVSLAAWQSGSPHAAPPASLPEQWLYRYSVQGQPVRAADPGADVLRRSIRPRTSRTASGVIP
jgi:hypothetical protein